MNPRAEIQGVAPDAVRVDRRWYEIWERADLSPFLAKCLGFDQMVFPPQIRHVRKPTHFVPWHQDIAYQISMGLRGHKEVATCFVPLDDEPSRHTTLEFALRKRQEARPHIDAGIFHNALKNASFKKTVAFDLRLGDFLFFGALIPHRTFRKPYHREERLSMEFRVTRRAAVIPGKDYFDLKTRRFYLSRREDTDAQIKC